MSRGGLAQVTAALRDPGRLSAVGLALYIPAALVLAALAVGMPLWLAVDPVAGAVAGAGAGTVAGLIATGWWLVTIARMKEVGDEDAERLVARR